MGRERLGAQYRKLWVASTVSNVGDGITLTAAPLLAASLTRDPRLVAGLSLATALPWLLFALVAGALVDRLDRRRVMWVADTFRTLALAVVAFGVVTDHMGLPALYVVFFSVGMAETMFDNASQAILPSVVRRDQLTEANGRLQSAEVLGNSLAGPPLGGLLYAAAAAVPFLVDSISFLVSAILVLWLRGRFRAKAPGPRRALTSEIGEGVRWLWGHRLLRALALMLGTMNMVYMAAFSVLVLFSQERLGLGAFGFGVLGASGAAGGVLAGATARRVTARLGDGTALVAAVAILSITMLVIAPTRSPFVAGSMIALSAYGSVLWNVITVSLRQAIIPDALFGRVNSAYRFVGWGSMPIGALVGGVLAHAFGLPAPFWVAGAVQLVMLALALPVINDHTVAEARQAAEPVVTPPPS